MSLVSDSEQETIKQQFLSIKDSNDLANILGVSIDCLNYNAYSKVDKYIAFTLKKKSGGERQIYTPISSLKTIQKKLNEILLCVYEIKPAVHGFVWGKSIVSNAKAHKKKRYVLNLDLQDFFPSINFGRVMGMFEATPFCFSKEIASTLAQLCCHDNQLPQGAPTSPIVSNFICRKLDSNLYKLAKDNKCTYTRYADDITFSTTLAFFPQKLALYDNEGSVLPGEELSKIIKDNHFQINSYKTRLQKKTMHQEVTGLTVNEFPNVSRNYINRIRGILHAWETYGYEATEIRFITQYYSKQRKPTFSSKSTSGTNILASNPPSLRKVLRGKIEFIGMVKGSQDPIYLKLKNRMIQLDTHYEGKKVFIKSNSAKKYNFKIATEGITDKKHIFTALTHFQEQGVYSNLNPDFTWLNSSKSGDKTLLSYCETFSKAENQIPTIFIFDRDNPEVLKKITIKERNFKDWGNKVYSLTLPVPEFRKKTPEICIELYYKDEDLRRKDENGRRIFLSSEFNPESCRHLNEDLNCNNINLLKDKRLRIIDDGVYNSENQNVALTKNDFADNILNKCFENIDFSAFKILFDLISTILNI